MTHQERDRLSIALGFSVVVHVTIAVLAGVFASSPPLPDYLPPLRVELDVPETVEPEPVPLPEPEPEPEPPPEPPPVPESEAPATPAPRATAPGTSAPGPAGSRTPSVGPDPLAGPSSGPPSEAEIWGRPERTEPRRQQPRENVLEVDPRSVQTDPEIPDWLGTLSEAGVSSDRMSESEGRALANLIQDPEFERMLTDAISGLESRAAQPAPGEAGSDPGAASGADPGTDTNGTADGSQGDPRLSWEGGERGVAGPLPNLTAADFDGRVPDETRFVVIFEVDEGGGVVPGSIIFQQRSRYTAVNEKLRRAIASWRFEPAPGAGTQSAVFTLIVRREDFQ